MRSYLDFEKPVAELEAKADELRALDGKGDGYSLAEEIGKLEAKASQALKDLYGALTPWQKTLVARHPQRPHFLDYCSALIDEFTPLAGDRAFAEDEAIVGGFGRFRGEPVCVIGQEKGNSTETRIRHNFGMPKPEGYRKAVRLMELADRFGLPVLSFIDTAGAYPGIEAEERGQQGADAGACDLFGDLAGRRGLDPLARHGSRAGRGDRDEDHRPGPAALRRDRQGRHRADRRRPSRPAGRDRAGWLGDRGGSLRTRRPQRRRDHR